MEENELNDLINALKTKALGNTIETITETWEKDKETGKNKLVGKTIKKTTFDIDTQACIKLIDIELKRREEERKVDPLSQMSDEELEREKKRLLKELAQKK